MHFGIDFFFRISVFQGLPARTAKFTRSRGKMRLHPLSPQFRELEGMLPVLSGKLERESATCFWSEGKLVHCAPLHHLHDHPIDSVTLQERINVAFEFSFLLD